MPVLLLAFLSACEDTLNVQPVNEIPADQAISDATTAYAALAGAYDALQDDTNHDYLSGSFSAFGDLPGDDVAHVGTFDTFAEADLNDLLADNGTIEAIWGIIYDAIARVNRLIEQVPNLGNVTQGEKDDILGQAHFLRALHYHNLVKHWGGVPLRLTTPASPAEAGQIARATVDEVYTQILADLALARTLLPTTKSATTASRGAVFALRTRVLLYRGDWAGVVANADSATALSYQLVSDFSALFTPNVTVEDVLRVVFTPEEEHWMGWWYRSKGAYGGRYEIAPTCDLAKAFDADVNCSAAAPYSTFNPTDQRAQATIGKNTNSEIFGAKWPTGIGDEGMHVIRYAEVILNKAEALARQNNLLGAVTEYNKTRVRAGLSPHVLGVDVAATQQAVLDAVWQERRLELAMEGHRWLDLVRTGRAVATLGLQNRPHQVLFPIPQQELDVAPNLTQNPGY